MTVFPFAAVVDHDDAKLALVLNAVDHRIGGVLLRGHKGSAKSTLARGLAALLGPGTPFVELPVSASEDRVVGSIDVAAALTAGVRRFHPGLLADADGGVLYVDEVNLLPDHLVDVLLDVAASGVNRVEREGISEHHPSRFVLIGSMNPEEGDLRPQLLDRFGLAVDITSSVDPDTRAEAVARRLAFDADPAAFARAWAGEEAEMADRVTTARRAGPAAVEPALVRTVSALCASVGAEGLRADLVICRAAAALAGWEGRPAAAVADVARVAALALGHRRRRSPLEDPGIDQGEIDRALAPAGPPSDGPGAGGSDAPAGTDGRDTPSRPPSEEPPALPSDGSGAGDPPVEGAGGAPPEGAGGAPPEGAGGAPPEGAGATAGDPPVTPPPGAVAILTAPATVASAAPAGRRSLVTGGRGRVVGDRTPAAGPVGDIAVGASLRAAAARRAGADADRPAGAVPGTAGPTGPLVQERDLREAVREQRTGNLIVISVDASASMGVQQRMAAVKQAIVSLLLDAYQRRDRVALVTFAGDGAQVVLRPTGSVEVARARLDEVRTGGRTPLAAGVDAALGLALQASPSRRPLLVLISDGRATAGPGEQDPVAAALEAATRVARQRVPAVVVDVEEGATRLGLAAELASAMGARHLPLPELTGDGLASGIRRVVAG